MAGIVSRLSLISLADEVRYPLALGEYRAQLAGRYMLRGIERSIFRFTFMRETNNALYFYKSM